MIEAFIYAIENAMDGKIYVGQTVDPERRRRQHWRALQRGDHRNAHLQRSFSRDGAEAFSFRILASCSVDIVVDREQSWIERFGAGRSYNICPAGASSLGVKRRPETRERLSAAKKGKSVPPLSPEAIARGAATRRAKWAKTPKASPPHGTGEKISAALRARWAVTPKKRPDDEARARMSAAAKKRWALNPMPPDAIARATASRAARHAEARNG